MLRNWTNHCNLRIEETFRSIGNKNMFFHHRSKLKLIKQFIAEKLLRKISNRGIFCVDIMVKESRFSKNRTWWGSSKIKSNVLYRGQEPVLPTFPKGVRVRVRFPKIELKIYLNYNWGSSKDFSYLFHKTFLALSYL